MPHTLTFVPWNRSGMYNLATGATSGGGRLRGEIVLTATVRDTATTRQGTAAFEIAGPGDVQGLLAGAVRRMVPPPLTTDAETPLMVHAELAEIDLPWRFTPQQANGRILRPWIVLVVCAESEIQLVAGNQAILSQTALAAHDLSLSARWAHIQIDLTQGIDDAVLAGLTTQQLKDRIAQDGGTPIARLVCPRPMEANTPYVAAVVPAFNANGSNRWQISDAQVQVPVYHHWTFRTGDAGDFRTLCAQLRAERQVGALGAADVLLGVVNPPVSSRLRGAISAVGGADAALPPAVTAATIALRTPGQDNRGRPIVGLPVYGSPWHPNPPATAWGAGVNDDPRRRAAGGVGLAAGILLQDEIVAAVVEQIGATEIVNQRLAYVATGIAASSSLWTRRLPANGDRQIALFWSASARMVTDQGPVLDRITAPDRPLSRALFSSAGRRILRPGPARTRFARPGAADPALVLRSANRCPPRPQKGAPRLLHVDDLSKKFQLSDLDKVLLEPGRLRLEALVDALAAAGEKITEPALRDAVKKLVDRLRRDLAQKRNLPVAALLELLRLLEQWEQNASVIAKLVKQLTDGNEPPFTPDVSAIGDTIRTRPPVRRCRPIDLDGLAVDLHAAIDPTLPDAWIKRRVLDTLHGLPDNSTQPVEVCTSVNLPAWRFLRDTAPDLLLPGVGQLTRDRVYAFESNPVFVEAFLLGVNHQALAELRWRNLRIASACTPLRVFWGRIAGGGGDPLDDIRSVGLWPNNSPLGDAQHRPAQVAAQNLILVFRTDLFRRYPDTIVSAIPAAIVNGQPNFDEAAAPDGSQARQWPVFQGSIGEDVTFFGFPFTPQQGEAMWFLLEEPPPGYRFRSDTAADAANGADFARVRFNDPSRVLIRGGEIL